MLLRVDLLHAVAEAKLKAQGADSAAGAGGKVGRSPTRRKATAAGAQQLKLNVRLAQAARVTVRVGQVCEHSSGKTSVMVPHRHCSKSAGGSRNQCPHHSLLALPSCIRCAALVVAGPSRYGSVITCANAQSADGSAGEAAAAAAAASVDTVSSESSAVLQSLQHGAVADIGRCSLLPGLGQAAPGAVSHLASGGSE